MRPERRSGSVPRRQLPVKARKTPPDRPAWDDTLGDLSRLKLTPEQLRQKRAARTSRNRVTLATSARSTVEDWTKSNTAAGSPHSWDDTHRDAVTPRKGMIDFSAVLQMLQRPGEAAGAAQDQPQQQQHREERSFEQVAAAAAAAMAEAVSRRPLDLTLNPRFGLLGQVEHGVDTAKEEGPHDATAVGPKPNEATSSPAPAGSHIGAYAERAVAPASLPAVSDLLERQQAAEARVSALEARLQDSDRGRADLDRALAELRQLRDEQQGLRRDLSEFSTHASTLMTFVHAQVLQLLRVQGLQPAEVGVEGASSGEPSVAEPVARPAGGVASEQRHQQPRGLGAWASQLRAEVGAAADGAQSPGTDQQRQQQQELQDGGGQSPARGADVSSSWMFHAADESPGLGAAGAWGTPGDLASTSGLLDSWAERSGPFRRSIFQDVTARDPAPTGAAAAPAQQQSPDRSRPPTAVSSAAWPVKDIEPDLDALPSYAAFRRSTVVGATAAAAAAAPWTPGTAGRVRGAMAHTVAAAAPVARAPAPAATGFGPGPQPPVAEPAVRPVRRPGVGFWVDAATADEAVGQEDLRSGAVVGSHAPSVPAAGAAAAMLRPLPTEFVPRNLGHTSILVQTHLGPEGGGGTGEPLAAAAAAVAGGVATREARWDGLRSTEARGSSPSRTAQGAGVGVGNAVGVQFGLRGSPTRARVDASLSLAAHAAAAARLRGKRAVSPQPR